jgi:glucosamine--fructose-6-phosphate aminotransferase (isomerizing)
LLGGEKIMNPYIEDILAQPAALRDALTRFSALPLDGIHHQLERGDFDRIILSGMGSSYASAYPAFIKLADQPVPVQFINAAELLHSLTGMLSPRSLLWLNSQSGRSAELVQLLKHGPAATLTFVNDMTSPMASQADVCIPIHAGAEATVSTKTYINMLAVNLLAAIQLSNGEVDLAIREMYTVADAMESYLADWQTHVRELDSLLGDFEQLFFIGRGSSMSAVWTGSLINKEAAKCAFEGMHAADFRHGPLELVDKGFTALVFAGPAQTSGLNHDLALEIQAHGGRVLWVDSSIDAEIPTLLLPSASELTRPLVEILPLQMLTLVMANRKGLQAGQFRYVSKVTSRE